MKGQGIKGLAHAQEAADRQDRISRPAASLVDHEGVDVADAVAVAAQHLHHIDLVRLDQDLVGGFAGGGHCRSLSCR